MKLVCSLSTVIVSVLVTYPVAETSTVTEPSVMPVKLHPPAEPVVLLVSPIVTVAPLIAVVPSLIVNEMSCVVSSSPLLSSEIELFSELDGRHFCYKHIFIVEYEYIEPYIDRR